MNNPIFGDFDKDGKTDFAFVGLGKELYIAEFNPAIMNFDSVYSFTSINDVGGITTGDFDLDGNTDIITSNIWGDVHVIEAQGVNQYVNVWNGTVDIHNSYYSFSTNDIDKNGKPEFWIGGKHWTSGILFTCFEYDSDNNYVPKFKIKIPDYYSLNPLTAFADDIDGDGKEEIIISSDYFILILKFSGNANNPQYSIWYFKMFPPENGEIWTVKAYDINHDNKKELFFDTYTVKDSLGNTYWKDVNRIFIPSFTTGIKNRVLSQNHKINLYQNYPNPFNPQTTIKFSLPEEAKVNIKIYNILGKEITELLNETRRSGEYEITWNGRDSNGSEMPSGVYFITVTTEKFRKTIKSILLK